MYIFSLVAAINAFMLLTAYLTLFAIQTSTVSMSISQVALAVAVAVTLAMSMFIQITLALKMWKAEMSSLRKLSQFTEDG